MSLTKKRRSEDVEAEAAPAKRKVRAPNGLTNENENISRIQFPTQETHIGMRSSTMIDSNHHVHLSLVFPKWFEFYKFLAWGLEKRWIRFLHSEGNRYHLEVYNEELGEIHCYVPQESDIGFHHTFATILKQHSHENCPNHLVVLVGSAGSVSQEDLGKLFFISSAHKVDRGESDARNRYRCRHEKVLEAKPSLQASIKTLFDDIPQKKAFSINFLNEAQLDAKFGDDGVYDMETYEFFQLCEEHKIQNFACLRFVTDKVSTVTEGIDDHFTEAGDTLVCKYAAYQWVNTTISNYLQLTKPSAPTPEKAMEDLKNLKKFVRLSAHVTFDPLMRLPNNPVDPPFANSDRNELKLYVDILRGLYQSALRKAGTGIAVKEKVLLRSIRKRSDNTSTIAMAAVADWKRLRTLYIQRKSDDE